jgi:hypothetical protein
MRETPRRKDLDLEKYSPAIHIVMPFVPKSP